MTTCTAATFRRHTSSHHRYTPHRRRAHSHLPRIQHSDCGPAQAMRERPSSGPTSFDREATASRCGGPRRMWAWRGMSTRMLWQSERQRAGRTPSTWGRPTSRTLREKPRRPGPGLPASGFGATSERSAAIGPNREGGFAWDWARFEKRWQAGITSSCQAMQQRRSTSGEWARPRATGVGGVVAASDRRTTTCSSSADAGRRRSSECNKESRRIASGSLIGPPPSASSFATSEQPLPFWSSWRTPR